MSNRIVTLTLAMSCTAVAQAPQLLGYQGRLLTTSGVPVAGPAEVRFSVFSTETAGSPSWSETQTLGLSGGYYATHLGVTGADAGAALEAAVASGTAWLELAVRAPGASTLEVLSPRQRFGSVAYALWAKHLKGGTVDATSISINGTVVIGGDGKLAAAAGYSAGPGLSVDTTTRVISLAAVGCDAGAGLTWTGSTWGCGGANAGPLSGVAPVQVAQGSAGPQVSVAVGTAAGTVAAGDDARFGAATRLLGSAIAAGAPQPGQQLSYNGTQWVAAAPPPSLRNLVVNGGFAVNQRLYASGTALAAGKFGHDRWKAGAGGATYTFADSGAPSTPITVTAGTVVQIVDGVNVVGGDYTLSWKGTAQGKGAGGAYGPSPRPVTNIVPSGSIYLEFGTGTLSDVQLEAGPFATAFEVLPRDVVLQRCYRYAYAPMRFFGPATNVGASADTLTAFVNLPTALRSNSPSVTVTCPAALWFNSYQGGNFTGVAVTPYQVSSTMVSFMVQTAAVPYLSMGVGGSGFPYGVAPTVPCFVAEAEL